MRRAGSRVSAHPSRGDWRCLVDGCPDYGVWVTPPIGRTALEDGQAHRVRVHGAQTHMPADELARIDRGRLNA